MKTIKVNGFDANVLTETKMLSFVDKNGGFMGGVEIDLSVRFSSNLVASVISGFVHEVNHVVAKHYRYVSYTLHSLMVRRSGEYSTTKVYTRNNGKWVSGETTIKNEVY